MILDAIFLLLGLGALVVMYNAMIAAGPIWSIIILVLIMGCYSQEASK